MIIYMDDSVNVITSFGPQSLSLPPEQRKELIIVLTEGWSKEKFGIFTKPLLDRYSGQFRKKKGNYNPRPGPKKRLYDMVLKYEREEFELNDYIDFDYELKEDAPVNATGVAVSTDTPLVRSRNTYKKRNKKEAERLYTRILKRYDYK